MVFAHGLLRLIYFLIHLVLVIGINVILIVTYERRIYTQDFSNGSSSTFNRESIIQMMENNLTSIVSGIDFKVLNNVTDPSITISPVDDTIYLSYAITEN